MNSLISAEQTWLLLGFVATGAAVSIALEQRSRFGARLGGPVIALGLAMMLSNLGVLPRNAPAYDAVDDYLVPLAIPLLLMRANLGRIVRDTGGAFGAFHLAAAGSILGALLAGWLFRAVVPQSPEVAGIMAASYIGGAVNFVALRATYDLPSELGNSLIVADNFIMALMFAVLILLSGSRWMLSRFRHPHTQAADAVDPRELSARHWQRKEVSLLDLAQALAIAAVMTGMAMTVTGFIRGSVESRLVASMIGNPFILITVFSVAFATAAPGWAGRIHGAEELGMLFLYLFFFVLGVHADLLQVLRQVPMLFLFCLVIAVVNLLFTLGVGRLLRLNLEELLLSVNASLGGAPSAAAMAISRGWSELVLPGLLIGIWGYVIGTTLGILTTELLRRLL